MNFKETLAELLKTDVGRDAYFSVDINSKLQGSDKVWTYLCHTAELPGETSATVSQKIYGVIEKHPVMASYNDITLSFYTLGNNTEECRKRFLQWITSITGREESLKNNTVNKPTTYNTKYKDEYSGTIGITQYSSTGEKFIKCTLKEAFPIHINQCPLSWSYANHAMEINVTFAYTEYEYEFFSNEELVAKPIITAVTNLVPNQITQFKSFDLVNFSYIKTQL